MSTEDNKKESIETFRLYKAELDKRELLNSDNYDKNILTLSSAGLVTSLTLIKDISSSPTWMFFLCASWILFGLSILSTISSFLLSNEAIKRQIKIAEDYYIHDDDSAIGRENILAKVISWVNLLSGAFFFLAIVSIIVFGTFNFHGKSVFGSTLETKEIYQVKPSNQPAKDVEKGSTIPPIIKKPQPQPQPQPQPPKTTP